MGGLVILCGVLGVGFYSQDTLELLVVVTASHTFTVSDIDIGPLFSALSRTQAGFGLDRNYKEVVGF